MSGADPVHYLVTVQPHTGRSAVTIKADGHSRKADGTSLVLQAMWRVSGH